MLRISAFIAVFALWTATASGALAQQAQSKSTQKGCYNSQTCVSQCMRGGVGKGCELWCQNRASTMPACK